MNFYEDNGDEHYYEDDDSTVVVEEIKAPPNRRDVVLLALLIGTFISACFMLIFWEFNRDEDSDSEDSDSSNTPKAIAIHPQRQKTIEDAFTDVYGKKPDKGTLRKLDFVPSEVCMDWLDAGGDPRLLKKDDHNTLRKWQSMADLRIVPSKESARRSSMRFTEKDRRESAKRLELSSSLSNGPSGHRGSLVIDPRLSLDAQQRKRRKTIATTGRRRKSVKGDTYQMRRRSIDLGTLKRLSMNKTHSQPALQRRKSLNSGNSGRRKSFSAGRRKSISGASGRRKSINGCSERRKSISSGSGRRKSISSNERGRRNSMRRKTISAPSLGRRKSISKNANTRRKSLTLYE